MSQVIIKDGTIYYPVNCCFCGFAYHATASIFQSDFGMLDFGRGKCPNCDKTMQLTLIPSEERMAASAAEE